ncbi:LemA family protein [Paenibacillus sp. M1]|uniref:LemA family protein n=1 Tax=Paenibacillus haidiansis TaxID=1574488 RepID=A0ABU7VW75_9BACL
MNFKGKGCLIPLIIVIAVVLILIALFAGNYNKFVAADEAVNREWSKIDVQLQRRYDLIPNLVRTVEGYAAHEKEVIQAIADARAALGGARTPDELAQADQQLSGALGRLLVVVENYPTLKADAQFTQLMDELAGTENRIAVARNDYNTAVASYNNMRRRFPGNLLAGMMGFETREYFETTPESRTNPEVDFGTGNNTSFNVPNREAPWAGAGTFGT